MFTHHAVQSFAFHPLGVRRLGSRRADWLPSDAAVSLCTGRFGLWSLCQQREAGGNRPQGQKKGCGVGARRPLRPSIIAVYLCHYYQVTPFARIFTDTDLFRLSSPPFLFTAWNLQDKREKSLPIVLNYFFGTLPEKEVCSCLATSFSATLRYTLMSDSSIGSNL